MTAHLPKKDFEQGSYENLSFESKSGLRQTLFGSFGRNLSFSKVLELSESRTVDLVVMRVFGCSGCKILKPSQKCFFCENFLEKSFQDVAEQVFAFFHKGGRFLDLL